MQIVDGTNHLDDVKRLIVEYTKFLGRDLSFQSIDDELSDLAAKYVAPHGRIICAQTDDGKIVGCVAYHRHTDERCEMKRLFVEPEYRKLHAGQRLVETIIELAKADGYKEMVLDTIAPLKSAVRLYARCGFVETDAYYDNPMSDVIYMKKIL